MGIKYNDWMRDNPTYEIIQLPQRGRSGPHYVTVNVSLPLEKTGGVEEGYVLMPLTQALKTDPALSKVSEFTGRA